MLEFQKVSKSYNDLHVLQDLNFTISSQKTSMLIGPSGCGKTTLLKLINRLEEPSQGTILWKGKKLSSYDPIQLRQQIGYVIQEIGLMPHLTVLENICLLEKIKKTPEPQRKKKGLRFTQLGRART